MSRPFGKAVYKDEGSPSCRKYGRKGSNCIRADRRRSGAMPNDFLG